MKVAIVYWSGTGNTQAMADLVTEAVKEKGAEVDELEASAFGPEAVAGYDAIAFGCPAMGDEVLEEDVFEPMFSSVEGSLKGKRIALFGSYGWGGGAYMDSWLARCEADGAQVVDTFACENAPDEEARNACIALGQKLVG